MKQFCIKILDLELSFFWFLHPVYRIGQLPAYLRHWAAPAPQGAHNRQKLSAAPVHGGLELPTGWSCSGEGLAAPAWVLGVPPAGGCFSQAGAAPSSIPS